MFLFSSLFPVPTTGPGFMSQLLLQPQHEVSGIGDDGSFARFLHKFALNVSDKYNYK